VVRVSNLPANHRFFRAEDRTQRHESHNREESAGILDHLRHPQIVAAAARGGRTPNSIGPCA
jgi:hypothetical protein